MYVHAKDCDEVQRRNGEESQHNESDSTSFTTFEGAHYCLLRPFVRTLLRLYCAHLTASLSQQDLASEFKHDRQLHVQQEYCKEYLKNNTSWVQLINEGNIIFAPFNYPCGEHWIAVVMWRDKKDHYIRVYNSWTAWRPLDLLVAAMFACLYNVMDNQTEPRVKWHLSEPYDNVTQRAKANRCATFVIARAWQVLLGQFNGPAMKTRTYMDTVSNFVQLHFLRYDDDLCGDKIACPYMHAPTSVPRL